MNTHRFFATTSKGLEPFLLEELKALGVPDPKPGRSGVEWQGDIESAYRVCLNARTCHRVLLKLKEFPCPNPEKLYGGVKSIRWTEHLSAAETLAVEFQSSRSEITHTQFGALKTKDAICDQLRSVTGERPSIDVQNADIRVNVYLHDNVAHVSLDLSGRSLHERGYRVESVDAPLKETLAAGLLLAVGWPELAQTRPLLLDPMCGSGTIAIEAYLMAARIAPQFKRTKFGFTRWKLHDRAAWERVKKEAEAKEIRDPRRLPRILAFDRDPKAVRAAITNIEAAGARGRIHVEKKAFSEITRPGDFSEEDKGVLVFNPPYGQRLGEVQDLVAEYRGYGDHFKQRFKGFEAHLLVGNLELTKEVGLKAKRKLPLWNGPIECRLMSYDLF